MESRIDKLLSFLKESPDDCFLNHALALEFVKAGRAEEARAVFEKNMDYDPSYVATYYHLGSLLEHSGLPDEALEIYARGMQQAREAGDMHSLGELRTAWENLADI